MNEEQKTKLAQLDEAIGRCPGKATLYMERGKLYNSCGVRDRALNDFLKAAEIDPQNTEAREYINMINEIFAFRYLDYYNP